MGWLPAELTLPQGSWRCRRRPAISLPQPAPLALPPWGRNCTEMPASRLTWALSSLSQDVGQGGGGAPLKNHWGGGGEGAPARSLIFQRRATTALPPPAPWRWHQGASDSCSPAHAPAPSAAPALAARVPQHPKTCYRKSYKNRNGSLQRRKEKGRGIFWKARWIPRCQNWHCHQTLTPGVTDVGRWRDPTTETFPAGAAKSPLCPASLTAGSHPSQQDGNCPHINPLFLVTPREFKVQAPSSWKPLPISPEGG